MSYHAGNVPFTAWFKVVPSHGSTTESLETHGAVVTRQGGKWDYIRDLQRLAIAVHDALAESGILYLASYGQDDLRSGMIGSQTNGLATRPQFGNLPALLMVEGIFDVVGAEFTSPPALPGGAEVDQPTSRYSVIHANSVYKGYGGETPWDATQGQATQPSLTMVDALKRHLNTMVVESNVVDAAGHPPKVYKMLYDNVLYGPGGHHFPQ